MKAIAIDDEPIALEVIRSLASKVPFLDLVACFTSALQALEYLQKNHVDLIFLDIKMPNITGLEFVATLQKKPLIIFTTAYSEHALASFELDAIDYLLKPFSLARFVKACNKAHNQVQLLSTPAALRSYFFLKTGIEQVKVYYDEILYMEATGNYVTYVLVEGKKLISRTTIGEVMEQLPANSFIRVHRSFIVAKEKVDKIERHQVSVQGNCVPVGTLYVQQLQLLSN